MTLQNEIQRGTPHTTLGKRALQGSGIALVLIVAFLIFLGLAAGEWIFLPAVTVTAAGALGGMVYHLIAEHWFNEGWKKVVATILCVLFYFVTCWLSMIIAFSITGHWD